MLWFDNDSLAKVALVASIIAVALLQQSNVTATPSRASLKKEQSLSGQAQDNAALARLNELISKDPNNALAYTERGQMHFHLGNFKMAIEDYTAAIKISPRTSNKYSLRANAYRELGEYQKEIDDLTSAIEIDPKFAGLFDSRADAYYRLGQLPNSIADSNTAANLDPTLSNAYLTAAKAYEELGLYDKALEPRTKLIGLKTNSAFNWNNRANDLELLRKYDLAQADRMKATKLASPSQLANMQLLNPLIDFNQASSERPKDKIDKQLKRNPVILPFHYDTEGHICVPVQVNGHPLQLILDTGSDSSTLWKQAMTGVAEMDSVQLLQTNANGTEQFSGFFRARDLKFGHLTLPNVPMTVDDGLVGLETISGFLGGNILENFVVTIDFTEKKVVLASSFEEDRLKKATVVPMMIRNHRPRCNVKLDGKFDVVALLDTGSLSNISSDSLLKPVLKKDLVFNNRMSGPWLGNLDVETVRLRSVELGASNIEQPIFDVFLAANAPAAAKEIILGNPLLSKFKTVTFDYLHRQIILEPNDTISGSAAYLYSEGRFYFQLNQMQPAINAFSKAINLDSEFALASHIWRAQAFINIKEYRKALDDITVAIELDPKNAWSYNIRAWVYDELGDYKLEISDATRAIRLAPQYQGAYMRRAGAYEKLGERQLADRDRRTAKDCSRQ